MRAVVCRELSGPQSLTLEEVPQPQPGPGEVAVAVAAAGLNFADTLMVAGKYQEKPPLPFTPGLELAGTVTALGEGVTGVAPGDRVIGLVDRGAFAEVALVRAEEVYPIPDTMDFEVAAGFPITYGTAHGALVWRAELQPGETLLVHGAAGGTGLAAVEVGKALGAQVIATAGGPEKLGIARAHGADHLIDYKTEDIRERVKALTGGHGAEVVFDPVGGEVFMASLRAVAWGGRLLVIGFAAGKVPEIPANLLLVKNLAVLGLYWGAYRQKAPTLLRRQFETLTGWYAEGRLKPLVSHRLDLAEAARALDLLLTRKATGKVVLTTGRG
ncbi:MAG: NADPH:quinone oxidoreductase family protein [Kiloniellales bacterium]|nr:NADPH:quinone oxidoreductase family protein [Kiloniellales bacterium]